MLEVQRRAFYETILVQHFIYRFWIRQIWSQKFQKKCHRNNE